MVKNIIDELRTVAQRCTRLARDCLDREIAHALEQLGVNLATKASELECRFDR